jgi:predicted SprT family Zn-dependent metalloprotease
MTPSSFQKRISARASTERNSAEQVEPRGEAIDLAHFAKSALSGLGLELLADKLTVKWNSRMRSTAGLAYPNSSQIVLNPKLAGFGWAEVERTLLHELAHLVAHQRCGRRRISPHGPEWRKACADLGMDNEARCHDLPLPRRKMARRFVYQCPACATKVERVRLFRRPAACLKCCQTHCGGRYDKRFNLTRVLKPESPLD